MQTGNDDSPFTVSRTDEETTIFVNTAAYRHPNLVTEGSCDWIRSLSGKVRVNMSQIEQLNSTLVAWLFQLVQWNRGQVSLCAASTGLLRQLKQYHLQHFIDFPTSDIDSSAYLPGTV